MTRTGLAGLALAALTAVISMTLGSSGEAQPNSGAKVSRFGEYRGYDAARFDGGVRASIYLPMRDGVRLAVDIYRPAVGGKPADGKFPVIWQGTMDRSFGSGASADSPTAGLSAMTDLTRYGYVVVNVERRGLAASFGARRGYHDRNEDYDAYEVTEWLAAQPWSTGAVGVWGCSNTGEAAMHVVSVAPPHLKAAFAGCFSWNKFDGMLRGGIFANWGTGPERTFEQDMMARPVDGDESRTLLRQAATEHKQGTVLLDLWKGMPYRDSFSPLTASRFWAEGSVSSYADQVRRSGVPIYIMGGWRDDFRKEGLVAYANLPGKKHIVIGPWRHCANDGLNVLAEAHRFFDFYLKGIDNGFEGDDPIHYFVMNAPAGHEWRSARAWPDPDGKPETLHLAAGGKLGAAASGGTTSFQVTYKLDEATLHAPEKVPGGTLAMVLPNPSEKGGPHFLGAVLAADTEVTGHPIADLWITSTASEANVFAYLEDVAPDGTVEVVADGRLRASMRKLNDPPYAYMGLPWHRGFAEDAEALTPGAPAHLVFDFLPCAYVFKVGHRIRISVAGADFRERDRVELSPPPTINILDTTEHPSVVILPVVTKG
jgi:putative CocE/NonD family hydrolase